MGSGPEAPGPSGLGSSLLTLCLGGFLFFPGVPASLSSLNPSSFPFPFHAPYVHTAVELTEFRGLGFIVGANNYTKGEMQATIHSFDKYLFRPNFVPDQLRHGPSAPGKASSRLAAGLIGDGRGVGAPGADMVLSSLQLCATNTVSPHCTALVLLWAQENGSCFRQNSQSSVL